MGGSCSCFTRNRELLSPDYFQIKADESISRKINTKLRFPSSTNLKIDPYYKPEFLAVNKMNEVARGQEGDEEYLSEDGRYMLEKIFLNENPELITIIRSPQLNSKECLATLNPSNKYLLVFDEENAILKYWKCAEQKSTQELRFSNYKIKFSKSNSFVVTYSIKVVKKRNHDPIYNLLYQVKDINNTTRFEWQGERIFNETEVPKDMLMSQDETLALFIRPNNTILICDIQENFVYTNNNKVDLLEITHDNQCIIGVATDKLIIFEINFELKKLQVNYSIPFRKASPNHIISIASIDNCHFFTGMSNGDIKFWSLQSDDCLYTLHQAHTNPIRGLIVTSDSKHMVSFGDYAVKIWDISDRCCLKTYNCRKKIYSVCLSADRRYIIVSYMDGEIRIWSFTAIFLMDFRSPAQHFLPVNSDAIVDIFFLIEKMPEDNSSLFHAIAYTLEHKFYQYSNEVERVELANKMRKIVSHYILNHKESFSNEQLGGKTVEEFAEWISEPSSYGSLVELKIFSMIYQVEFFVFNLGSGQYSHEIISEAASPKARIYLLKYPYKYSRYDVLVAKSEKGNYTGFLVDDRNTEKEMTAIVKDIAESIQNNDKLEETYRDASHKQLVKLLGDAELE